MSTNDHHRSSQASRCGGTAVRCGGHDPYPPPPAAASLAPEARQPCLFGRPVRLQSPAYHPPNAFHPRPFVVRRRVVSCRVGSHAVAFSECQRPDSFRRCTSNHLLSPSIILPRARSREPTSRKRRPSTPARVAHESGPRLDHLRAIVLSQYLQFTSAANLPSAADSLLVEIPGGSYFLYEGAPPHDPRPLFNHLSISHLLK